MHTETCAVHDDGPCTCGLDEAIDDLMLDEMLDDDDEKEPLEVK